MAAAREAPGEDSIRVVCRFRPINDAEKSDAKFVVKFPPGTDDQCVILGVRFVQYKQHNCNCIYNWIKVIQDPFYVQGKVYTFDKVFKPNVSQKGVYDEVAKSIVKGISNSKI